ncbi:hypothetical protein [Formivibrio citricus]|uniref:hypothetical protein n=1 Tax=Formivibrio citricus TaxID=83765 RepID=UPI0015A6B9B8|nr:hypothetical protein [Formivibrio citricus]
MKKTAGNQLISTISPRLPIAGNSTFSCQQRAKQKQFEKPFRLQKNKPNRIDKNQCFVVNKLPQTL